MVLGLTPEEQALALQNMGGGGDGGGPAYTPADIASPAAAYPQNQSSVNTPPPPAPIGQGDLKAAENGRGLNADDASYAARIADESNSKAFKYDPARDTGARGWWVQHGILKPEAQVANDNPTPSLISYDPKIEGEKKDKTRAAEEAAKPVLPSATTPSAPARPRPGSGGAIGANPMTGLLNQADTARQEQINSRLVSNGILDDADKASSDRVLGQQLAHQSFIDDQTRIAAERKAIEDKAQSSADMRDKEIRAQIKDLQAKGIDPERMWNNAGTGTKILAALSMAGGAFGSAVPHTGGKGRNYAMELINGAIDKDIAAQKVNYDKKWDALTTDQNLNKSEHDRNMFVADQKQREELTARYKLDAQLSSYDSEFNNATFRQKSQEIREGNQDKIDQLKIQGVQDRMTVLQRQQAAQAQAAAAANDPLSKVPPKERAEATKELKQLQDHQNATAELEDAKKSGDRKAIATATSRLMTISGIKGKENNDITRDVGSWTRSSVVPFTDTPAETATTYAGTVPPPASPTLDRYGIRVGGARSPGNNSNQFGGTPSK